MGNNLRESSCNLVTSDPQSVPSFVVTLIKVFRSDRALDDSLLKFFKVLSNL